ncbi:MAG: hypothetical protein LBV13_03820 [Methanomassiliicoccaceae archaeon]|jgi:thioredoxin-like negative regulator of GroEL|nr:hypothetical protein [Methanomassiliicoccaceae archaeon]
MDIEKTFASIQLHIKNEEYGKVRPMVDTIADPSDDPRILLKCASLLKAVDDEDGCQRILDKVARMTVSGAGDRLMIARSLRGLGRPEEAYGMMADEDDDDMMLYEKAATLRLMGRNRDALSKIRKITSMTSEHRMLMTEILCSAGEFEEAHDISLQLVEDDDASYASLVNLCGTLMLMGRNKEAIKTAKQHLKEDKKDVDSLALNAYVMRINGRIPAAANFAHRALSVDSRHKGALETMAFCLIEKSRLKEAKMCAGAINEISPGDPAAIRILDACRRSA